MTALQRGPNRTFHIPARVPLLNIPAGRGRPQMRSSERASRHGLLYRAVPLAVPNGEADLFLDPSIDWVLFAAIVANEHVVDAGGGLI